MWFKQIQLFTLPDSFQITSEELEKKLKSLAFTPCLPSMPISAGWVAPVEGEEDLVCTMNDCLMICVQFEERVLPATVVRQAVDEQVKKIESQEDRKVRQKEKLSLKDEMTLTLLPRAFTKQSKVYAYFDCQRNCLVVNSTNASKLEKLLSLFKKSFAGVELKQVNFDHLSRTLSRWVLTQQYPDVFHIEKNTVLQDVQQTNRIIRCQQQNLFSENIQALIKDGCAVKQLSLTWHDRITFSITDPFSLRSICFDDDIKNEAQDEADTALLRFQASFLMMTNLLRGLLKDLCEYCGEKQPEAVG